MAYRDVDDIDRWIAAVAEGEVYAATNVTTRRASEVAHVVARIEDALAEALAVAERGTGSLDPGALDDVIARLKVAREALADPDEQTLHAEIDAMVAVLDEAALAAAAMREILDIDSKRLTSDMRSALDAHARVVRTAHDTARTHLVRAQRIAHGLLGREARRHGARPSLDEISERVDRFGLLLARYQLSAQ